MNVSRIALPGYNAATDTNPDHFSLYSDIDNILIKRKQTATARITDGSPTTLTVPHNLGYIPYFTVYFFDQDGTGQWTLLNNQNNAFEVPSQQCAVDTTNLYIINNGGHSLGYIDVLYDIFYDNMSDDTAPFITESPNVYKVERPGINALQSRNPNDYIMHSDLNNFKIIKEGVVSVDMANRTDYTFAHGATVQAPYKYLLFIKRVNDGKTTLIGGTAITRTYSESSRVFGSSMDGTNITYYTALQSSNPDTWVIKYYIFGTGVENTIPNAQNVLAVAKEGVNALTESNPENFNFHSAFPTLKYYQSGSYSMTVSDTTVHTIAHNLGYVPCFLGFVVDLSGVVSNGYALMPYYYGRSSIPSPNRDVGASIHADETNIYLKAYFQASAVGTPFTFNFYYKIFKNNLGV